MAHRYLLRGTVAAAVATLALAGCSSSDDSDDSSSSETTTATADCGDNVDQATPGPVSTNPLKIGTLLPATGDLSYLGPPEFAGVDVAVADINAAGGVLDQPIQTVNGDSGDATTDTANLTVDRELGEGVQVIIGAASSGVSLKVLDKIASAGAVMFSPANTSDQFTCYKDKGMYFRTAPADTLQGQALSQVIAEAGVQRVAIVARNDPYGTGLADNTAADLEAAGIPADQIDKIIYDPNAQSFNAEVDQIKSFDPDGIAVIGFDESAKILTRMNEVGIGPKDKAVFGVDGNMGQALGDSVGPGILQGMKGTQPLTAVAPEFRARLMQVNPDLIDFNYAQESYDATVISALAAEIAKSTNGMSIASEINGVTKDGTKCTTYAECLALVKAGTDIDYDGVTGELAFVTAGEPSIGSYGVLEFDANNKLIDPVADYKVVSDN